jgi:integrase
MASINKQTSLEGKATFRVRVRLQGHPIQTATFDRLTDAKKWASATETAIREGRYFVTAEAKKRTLKDLITRYRSDVLPTLRSASARIPHLDWWEKKLGAYALADIQPSRIIEARKTLSKTITPRGTVISDSTINRYMATMSHGFTIAMKEWQWVGDNPFFKITTFKEPEGIIRFLSDEERARLLTECKAHSQDLYALIVLALSTGARRMEMLSLTWDDVDLKSGLVTFPKTKNGDRRTVPITGHALELVKAIAEQRRFNSELLFPGRFTGKPMAIQNIFQAALKRAGIENFRFHDLRHSAASYMVMAGIDMRTIAEILGHKDLKMTLRYAHLSRKHVSDAVGKLDGAMFGGV